jgi:hypothetical protein
LLELERNIRPKAEFDLVVARPFDPSLDPSMPPMPPAGTTVTVRALRM